MAGWTASDRVLTRLNAIAHTFTKTDRILTGNRAISVSMTTTAQSGVNAPGFSDGKSITINYDQFKDIGSPVSLVRLLGLNYHELSHILFTPRKGTALKDKVAAMNLGMAFNALEDMRIETLFSGTYKPAGKYFTEMVVEFFVEQQESWPFAHMLTHGRRFIPLEIRQEFAARFGGDAAQKKRVEEIIDEYRLLDLSSKRADDPVVVGSTLALVREYDRIMKDVQNSTGQNMPNPFNASEDGQKGCGHQEQSAGKDDPLQRQAAQNAQEQTEEQDEVEEDGETDGSGFWDDVPDEDEENDDEGTEADSDGEDSEDDADDSDAAGDDDSDDGDDSEGSEPGEDHDEDGDDDSDGQDGEADGSDGTSDDSDLDDSPAEPGHGSEGTSDEDLTDILKDTLNGVMESETVQGDIRQMSRAMNDPNAFDVDGPRAKSTDEPAEPHVVTAFTQVQKEFRRLWAQIEPGWKYGSDTGRLNVQRAMNSDDMDDVFDEWDEGHEHDAGLEVVISLDQSGSMSGQEIHDACNALWIIKRACDDLDIPVSVMGFDVYTRTLFGRKDKVQKGAVSYFPANGADTCPAQSFRNARRVLSQSEAPNKLFIILTDGGWSSSNNELQAPASNGYPNPVHEDLNDLIRSIPGTTMFLGIGYGAMHHGSAASFDVAANVSHASEIAPIIKSAILRLLRTAVR